VFDPVNGLADIEKRRVRFIGDPEKRIREDYLRILRFFRFFADYDEGDADLAALTAIEKTLDGMETLSRERIRAEFLKILCARRATETILLMNSFDILPHIVKHALKPDVFARAVSLFPDLPSIARLAALLDMSAFDRELIRVRLRLSNDEMRQLDGIHEAMTLFDGIKAPHDERVLRAVSFRASKRHALAALAIHAARHGRTLDEAEIAAIDGAPQNSPFTGDLMLSLGVKPGPEMGHAITRAELIWIEANMPADPDKISELARRATMVN
jgi:poly(A) polymerase